VGWWSIIIWVMADQPLNGLAARKLLHKPLPLSRNTYCGKYVLSRPSHFVNWW
jgi:hypothetical protein